MHIIFLAVTALAALATWYMRLRAIGQMARDAKGLAARLGNAPRKFAFMRRAQPKGLKGVDDPTEAAAIIMVLVAGAGQGREISPNARIVYLDETAALFDLKTEEAEGLLTYALWMVRGVELPMPVARRLTQVLTRSPGITGKELVDLDSRLVILSEADGLAAPPAEGVLQAFRDGAGLSV